MARDTAAAAAKTQASLEAVTTYLRRAGLEVASEWLPDFDRAELGDYAHQIGADVIATIRRGFWAELWQGNYRPKLEREDLKILNLNRAA